MSIHSMALVLQEHNLNKAHPLFLNSLTHKQLQPKGCSHTNTMQTNANFLPVMGHCHVQKKHSCQSVLLCQLLPTPRHLILLPVPALPQKTKEDIGLVVILPRTFPLPVTNTVSHCCQLQSLSSCCQAQSCQETEKNIWLVVVLSSPARKQRKTLGWWWSYQELIHCQWQTLSHIAANSRAFHPVARSSPARKQRKTFG